MKPDQERVRNLLTDTVTLLCKNGLQYQTELRVQGVLGITLDNNDVFIVHINEKFGDAIGGALTIRNDDGDAAKMLSGGTRVDTRKSHNASRIEPIVIDTKPEEVHRRRRRSREHSASPALPTNSNQQHILQRPVKRLMTSHKEASPTGVRSRSSLHNSSGNNSAIPGRDDVVDVKVKTEVVDVLVLEESPDSRTEMSGAPQHIPHTTDQSAMQESYPNLSLSELQGSYQPFGEILGVTDSSTNSGADGTAPPATKRRATSDNTQDSLGGSSEMGPTSDAGGPFITGIIQNETMTGDVVPQTTTATWDPSQIPDFGTLTSRDSQMILDSTPGCSTWDTSQQSQLSAMGTPTSHTIQNTSDQSSETVYVSGPASCLSTGQGGNLTPYMVCTGDPASRQQFGTFTNQVCIIADPASRQQFGTFTNQARTIPAVSERNQENCNGTYERCPVRTEYRRKRFLCMQCKRTFAWKGGLNEHVKFTHQKQTRYQCKTCGKGFNRPSHFDDHLATHTGVKRNVCPICQSHFTYKQTLTAHILHLHPNEVPR